MEIEVSKNSLILFYRLMYVGMYWLGFPMLTPSILLI